MHTNPKLVSVFVLIRGSAMASKSQDWSKPGTDSTPLQSADFRRWKTD